MLHEVADMEDVVVACGGGTPCYFDNVDHMNERGLTVFLEASESRLFARLAINRSRRPLIKDLDDDGLLRFIGESLATRLPHYQRAQHRFCGDRLEDAEQISETVERFVAEFGPLLGNK
jgi:shikimate kinase